MRRDHPHRRGRDGPGGHKSRPRTAPGRPRGRRADAQSQRTTTRCAGRRGREHRPWTSAPQRHQRRSSTWRAWKASIAAADGPRRERRRFARAAMQQGNRQPRGARHQCRRERRRRGVHQQLRRSASTEIEAHASRRPKGPRRAGSLFWPRLARDLREGVASQAGSGKLRVALVENGVVPQREGGAPPQPAASPSRLCSRGRSRGAGQQCLVDGSRAAGLGSAMVRWRRDAQGDRGAAQRHCAGSSHQRRGFSRNARPGHGAPVVVGRAPALWLAPGARWRRA